MYESKDILDGARALRPYLRSHIENENEATIIDSELVSLLAQAEGGRPASILANEVIEVVRKHPKIREWMKQYLQNQAPPEVTRMYQPLPGKPSLPPAPAYECPQKDYTWYRTSPGDPIPTCPTHGLLLIQTSDTTKNLE